MTGIFQMKNKNDDDIIDLFFDRNEDAIRLTSEKYGSLIKYIIRNIVGDETTVEECENDTYLGLWNTIPPNEPRNQFSAYVTGIARNKAVDVIRKRTSIKRNFETVSIDGELSESLPGINNIEEEEKKHIINELLNSFLKSLPKEQRMVFVRRYWYCDSIKTIAAMFGMSESKVKTMLYRNREKLKKAVEKAYE